MSLIRIRPVCKNDIDSLAELESLVWTPLHSTPLTWDMLAAWYAEHSPFFLVAEYEKTICGFYFGRTIDLSPVTALKFLDSRAMYAGGFHSYPRDPKGRSLYGITMLSVVPKAGKALYEAVWQLKREQHVLYSVGISRLPGLREYVKKHHTAQEDEKNIALWYAVESTRLLRVRLWPTCELVQEPNSYMRLSAPDRMLAFHTYGTSFGLLGILPEFMTDPASLNYGAVILSEYPHK